jgi:hypothetical protein
MYFMVLIILLQRMCLNESLCGLSVGSLDFRCLLGVILVTASTELISWVVASNVCFVAEKFK